RPTLIVAGDGLRAGSRQSPAWLATLRTARPASIAAGREDTRAGTDPPGRVAAFRGRRKRRPGTRAQSGVLVARLPPRCREVGCARRGRADRWTHPQRAALDARIGGRRRGRQRAADRAPAAALRSGPGGRARTR